MSEDFSYCDARWVMQQQDPLFELPSKVYSHIRSRQLENTYPGDKMQGIWPTSFSRVFAGWGAVPESEWPYSVYKREGWPPSEPPGLDEKAKPRRCHYYEKVRGLQDCLLFLAHGMCPGASFWITKQWYKAERGQITMPGPDDKRIGGHCVSIIGFELLHRYFLFENSWGQQWGNDGFGCLPFEFFHKYLVETYMPQGIELPSDVFQRGVVGPIRWCTPDRLGQSIHGGDMVHGQEIYDGVNDERMGWTFAVHRNGFLDVEEFFVRPQHRRQGIAGQLVDMLLDLSKKLDRPLRVWISRIDRKPQNLPVIIKIVERLGLRLYESKDHFAAAVAVTTDVGERVGLQPIEVSRPAEEPPAIVPGPNDLC